MREMRRVTHSCGCAVNHTLENVARPLIERMVAQLEQEPCGRQDCPRRVGGMKRLLARVAQPSANGKGEG